MPSKSKVYFFFQNVHISLKNRSDLKKYIEWMFRKESKRLEMLNYIFCSDSDLLGINRSYLKHEFYTDIITFDLTENSIIKGEIYISTDRVRDNARKLGVTFKSELHRIIFHGILHLCGYNDKTREEKKIIRQKEDYYLKNYRF